MPFPHQENQILAIGNWILLQTFKLWVSLTPQNRLFLQGAVDLGLLLGAVLLGLLIFRQTQKGKGLFVSAPRTYLTINGAFIAPFGFGLLALSIALAAPSWSNPPGLPLIPTLQSLTNFLLSITFVAMALSALYLTKRASLSQIALGTGAALTLLALVYVDLRRVGSSTFSWAALGCVIATVIAIWTAVRRCSTDRGLKSHKGESRWATRGEVLRHKTARFRLPLHVSYTGRTRVWSRSNVGAGRTFLALPNDTVVRHILLRGQSGAAKGYGIFAPLIASCTTAFIYQDFKAECPGFELQRKRTGQEPIRWGAAGYDTHQSMSWNPLAECRNSAFPGDEFGFLATVLVPSQADKADWVADLTRPILHYLFVKTNYQHLGELHDAVVERGVGAILREAEVPQGLVEALEGKNVKEYIGTTLFSVLSNFGTGWARKVTEEHDFAVDEILDRGGYVLSTENDPTRRLPLNLFWRFVIRRIFKSNRKRPCMLLLDEALAVGRLSNITDILEAARSKDIGVVFGVQHSAGIKRVYQEAADSLVSGFSSRITLLNGLSPADRKELHDSFGERVVKERGHGNTMERTLVDLMSKDDLDRRCNQYERWWAIIEAVGATHAGNKILGILQGLPGLTVPPPASKVIEGAISIEECRVTPGLASQAATRSANEAEVSAALEAANALEILAKSLRPLTASRTAPDEDCLLTDEPYAALLESELDI